MASVAEIVRTHGKSQPERTAIAFADRVLSYGELDERSSRAAGALRGEGVAPQTNVAFLDKNTPEYFEMLFGAAKLNAVLCAVNWRLAPPEAAFVINDCEATVLVVGAELLPLWEAFRDRLANVVTTVVIGGDPPDGTIGYEAWLASQPPIDPGVIGAIDDVALQFYSSGTTGRPKGVMLTNGNCFASVDANNASLLFHEAAVNMVAMPMFHVAGGAWGLFGLYNGVPNVIMREVDPAGIVAAIAEHGITHTVLVPAVIQAILGLPDLDRRDLASLEVLIYGASPISESVLKAAIRTFGCNFFQAYGMTETTGGCVLLLPEDHDPDGPHAHRLRAAGKASPGTTLRVVDPATGEDCPPGIVGEVLTKGAQNMKGYWRLPAETSATLDDDGWLHTGDAGYLDEDGYLYIHDRVKDMIISGGENIYPAEIENVLMAHPSIADAAVIGVPDEKWGESPKAIVVAAAGTAPDPDEIIAYCRAQLAHYKCPRTVDFIDALPRNPSGKVLKRELREPYWAGRERRVH